MSLALLLHTERETLLNGLRSFIESVFLSPEDRQYFEVHNKKITIIRTLPDEKSESAKSTALQNLHNKSIA